MSGHGTANEVPGSGTLELLPATDHENLLGAPVHAALDALRATHPDLVAQARVCAIDPADADTEVMTPKYHMDLRLSCNCILVAGKRAGEERVAACVARADTNVDVNHTVKRLLDVRKASFWPQQKAVDASGMEYGGITPVGVPDAWRLLLDSRVTEGWACIGSGVRHSKLFVPGALLAALPRAEVIQGLARPA